MLIFATEKFSTGGVWRQRRMRRWRGKRPTEASEQPNWHLEALARAPYALSRHWSWRRSAWRRVPVTQDVVAGHSVVAGRLVPARNGLESCARRAGDGQGLPACQCQWVEFVERHRDRDWPTLDGQRSSTSTRPRKYRHGHVGCRRPRRGTRPQAAAARDLEQRLVLVLLSPRSCPWPGGQRDSQLCSVILYKKWMSLIKVWLFVKYSQLRCFFNLLKKFSYWKCWWRAMIDQWFHQHFEAYLGSHRR